jgi:hypothetical protein
MFSFLLIGSLSRSIDINILISSFGVFRRERGLRYISHGIDGMRDGWIAIEKIEGVEKDFDSRELELVSEFAADPCFYLVEGRNGKFIYSDWFVLGIERAEDFLIDNDHGVMESAKNIQFKIKNGDRWLTASV